MTSLLYPNNQMGRDPRETDEDIRYLLSRQDDRRRYKEAQKRAEYTQNYPPPRIPRNAELGSSTNVIPYQKQEKNLPYQEIDDSMNYSREAPQQPQDLLSSKPNQKEYNNNPYRAGDSKNYFREDPFSSLQDVEVPFHNRNSIPYVHDNQRNDVKHVDLAQSSSREANIQPPTSNGPIPEKEVYNFMKLAGTLAVKNAMDEAAKFYGEENRTHSTPGDVVDSFVEKMTDYAPYIIFSGVSGAAYGAAAGSAVGGVGAIPGSAAGFIGGIARGILSSSIPSAVGSAVGEFTGDQNSNWAKASELIAGFLPPFTKAWKAGQRAIFEKSIPEAAKTVKKGAEFVGDYKEAYGSFNKSAWDALSKNCTKYYATVDKALEKKVSVPKEVMSGLREKVSETVKGFPVWLGKNKMFNDDMKFLRKTRTFGDLIHSDKSLSSLRRNFKDASVIKLINKDIMSAMRATDPELAGKYEVAKASYAMYKKIEELSKIAHETKGVVAKMGARLSESKMKHFYSLLTAGASALHFFVPKEVSAGIAALQLMQVAKSSGLTKFPANVGMAEKMGLLLNSSKKSSDFVVYKMLQYLADAYPDPRGYDGDPSSEKAIKEYNKEYGKFQNDKISSYKSYEKLYKK